MPTEPENSSHKPDPTSASEDRRVDAPNAQHVEELRAELNGAMNPRERKAISEELTRARDYLSTVDLLARLEEHRPQIEARDPQLAGRIDRVADTFLDNPHERLRDPNFKTDLAYALQDAEKLVEPLRVDRNLRDELTQLAASSPGLKNEQMRSLLQKTETLDDPDLVARLREKAAEIAAKSNQATKAVQGEIFALSFEVLEAKRREPAVAPSASSPIGSESATAKASLGDVEPPSSASEAAADTGIIAARQAEIAAFDDPAAPSWSVTSSRPSPDPEGPSEAESSRTSPAAADDLRHTAPVASTAAPSEANEASAAEPAEQAADMQSTPADKAKIEIAAFDASSPSAARPSTTSEPVRDVANPQPKSPQAASLQTPASAAGGAAAASTPANDDRNLAASAARPASPATSPKAPEPPERPEETDPTTKHEVQIVQEKLVVRRVFGKALGVVGRSASAIGRILEAPRRLPKQRCSKAPNSRANRRRVRSRQTPKTSNGACRTSRTRACNPNATTRCSMPPMRPGVRPSTRWALFETRREPRSSIAFRTPPPTIGAA